MRRKYIPFIIMLVAGLVACIITIIFKYDVLDALTVILAALIIFYIIGLILKKILDKYLIEKEEETQREETQEETQENAGEETITKEQNLDVDE